MTSFVVTLIDFVRVEQLFQKLTPPIYSDRFIWYEKAFLTCPMDLVSNRKSVICIFVQVSPASYEGQLLLYCCFTSTVNI